ncbi:unnamed protein product [Lymnaea stagnalis]|uniref:Calpain catalytic domain-containing protein n=1 Tax=Lymnaea stagnalis TaxID=6523 RepID=A0AAV2H7C5_LYMST
MSNYFYDTTFPPNYRSAYGRDFKRGVDAPIEWKRPSELVWQPEFVVDGATSHDMDQGALGNCWFIAAAAALATQHPDQFKRVVPLNQTFRPPQYTGKFVFYFWWQGTWRQVEIDDYLPTNNGRPIYCRNVRRPDEFWPCLLEKAYAKLNGSYAALEGGLEGKTLDQALVALTGGNPEVLNLRGQTRGSPELFERLYSYNQRKDVMGAVIYGGAARASHVLNGLISGHAYSITGFRQVELFGRKVNLVRLRNPWGRGEWQGAWSDNSQEMNAMSMDLKRALLFEIKDDGEFWMNFDDFIAMFDEIAICHL